MNFINDVTVLVVMSSNRDIFPQIVLKFKYTETLEIYYFCFRNYIDAVKQRKNIGLRKIGSYSI